MIAVCSVEGCRKKVLARGLCSMHYDRMRRTGDPNMGGRPAGEPGICSVDGCSRRCRSRVHSLCNAHYNRVWRKGSTEDRKAKPTLVHSHGYLVDYCPGHPLATAGAPLYVYQHRRVFYDAHGAGPFNCHVCAAVVTWRDMHVDHLNDNPSDNRIDNLAPACPECNKKRGQHKMIATRRKQGVQLTAFGRTRCITEWAADLGISRVSLKARLANGWNVERAVSEPRGKFGPAPHAPHTNQGLSVA